MLSVAARSAQRARHAAHADRWRSRPRRSLGPRSQPVHGTIDDNAIEPRAEVGARLESPDLAVGAQKALLHDVLGVLLVAGHPQGQDERTVAVLLHQRTKRVIVASTGAGEDGGRVAGVHRCD